MKERVGDGIPIIIQRKQREAYITYEEVAEEVADTKTAIATNCWHCRHTMQSRSIQLSCVRASVGLYIRPSVPLLLWARRPADIDCCTAANTGSDTLSAPEG